MRGAKAKARAELAAMYDSPEWLRPPARCPLCGSRTTPAYHGALGSRVGYLRCVRRGHVLRWDCCGKKRAKLLRRQREKRGS